VPSHLVWLEDRARQQFLDVQQSSNGLASGVSVEDALLQALYELVERDSWTINQYVHELLGTPPLRVPLTGLPVEMEWSISLIRKAGLYPFLFQCRNEFGIPVFGCALFGADNVGYFGGYGAHLLPRVAAQRAILESVQSRLCYISGARDDLYRRDFILMKQSDSRRLITALDKLPIFKSSWAEFASAFVTDGYEFRDSSEELHSLLNFLRTGGINQLYYRVLREEEIGGSRLAIVKAIAPQLEGAWCENWKTNGRAQRRLAQESPPTVSDGNAG
jgi:YcaO-like protein with predicted kinase domain